MSKGQIREKANFLQPQRDSLARHVAGLRDEVYAKRDIARLKQEIARLRCEAQELQSELDGGAPA